MSTGERSEAWHALTRTERIHALLWAGRGTGEDQDDDLHVVRPVDLWQSPAGYRA